MRDGPAFDMDRVCSYAYFSGVSVDGKGVPFVATASSRICIYTRKAIAPSRPLLHIDFDRDWPGEFLPSPFPHLCLAGQ